jgi:hypothetical protein
MFTFIKQLFGFDKPTMKDAGVQLEQAPYKVPEPAAVTPIPLVVETTLVTEALAVTSMVQQPATETTTAPTKKPRKPRAPKVVAPVEKPATKKAALVKKAAAIKATTKARTSRSKKA